MIYELPEQDQPIRQGDIFYPLPFTFIENPDLMNIIDSERIKRSSWDSIQNSERELISVPVIPVWGIVASQDCDASRIPYISFFQINSFSNASGLTLPQEESHNKWVNIITKHSRLNAHWFYLPKDENLEFRNQMAVNFHQTLLISRDYLKRNLPKLRKFRLNVVAFEHYRESIAQYYRRYPYNEWYSMTKEQLIAYKEKKCGVEPYEWQK